MSLPMIPCDLVQHFRWGTLWPLSLRNAFRLLGAICLFSSSVVLFRSRGYVASPSGHTASFGFYHVLARQCLLGNTAGL